MTPFSLGYDLAPRHRLASFKGAAYILQEVGSISVDQVIGGHIGVEEGQGISLFRGKGSVEDAEEVPSWEGLLLAEEVLL